MKVMTMMMIMMIMIMMMMEDDTYNDADDANDDNDGDDGGDDGYGNNDDVGQQLYLYILPSFYISRHTLRYCTLYPLVYLYLLPQFNSLLYLYLLLLVTHVLL